MKVLELGSGTGVVGISVPYISPNVKESVCTDIGEHLPLIQQNIDLNPTVADRVRVANLDWTSPEDLGQWDVILGSDISYLNELFPPLLTTLDMNCKENTLVIFSREIRKDTDLQLYKIAGDMGWTFTEIPFSMYGKFYDPVIKIHKISRQK